MEYFFPDAVEHYLTGSVLVRAWTRGDCRPAAGARLQVEAGPSADCGPG